MPILNMMVGLPGSGKTTYAYEHKTKNDVVLSSDALRQEMFGDVNDQTHNQKVFSELYRRMRVCFNHGTTVWLDATNINMKSRRKVFNQIPKGTIVNAVVLVPMIDECVARDEARSRTVGEEVIEKFVNRFEMPIYEEGLDRIDIISDGFMTYQDYDYWLYHAAAGFEQTGKYHKETLDEHLQMVAENVMEKYPIDSSEVMGAYLHDVGKLWTRTQDKEGNYHFYNHGNVGAYDFLSVIRCINTPVSLIKRYQVAKIINYHDYSFAGWDCCNKKFSEEFVSFLKFFRECDEKGSIKEEKV